jgi:hypothetical protein
MQQPSFAVKLLTLAMGVDPRGCEMTPLNLLTVSSTVISHFMGGFGIFLLYYLHRVPGLLQPVIFMLGGAVLLYCFNQKVSK